MTGKRGVGENLPSRQQQALNEGPHGAAADGGGPGEAGTWLRTSSPTSAAGASSSSGA